MTKNGFLSGPAHAGFSPSFTALAGYVAGLGFLTASGMFVSFMSANLTRFAVHISARSMTASIALSLRGAFPTGLVVATLLSALHQRRKIVVLVFGSRPPIGQRQHAAPGCDREVPPIHGSRNGAENLVVQRNGEVNIGLTYMTGAVVKTGQRTGVALLGGPR
jgi:uncharacterized membrane protein YoaK (UPF0700 family)